MVEHERSYIFTDARFEQLKYLKTTDVSVLTDCYLDRSTRVRKVSRAAFADRFLMTVKTGKKADGYRIENEFDVPRQVFETMASKAALTVRKCRQKLDVGCPDYEVTADFIEAPMKLIVVEVEAKSEAAMPVAEDVTEKLFGLKLRSCPLSAFELFKRKVGICGGPSAGKSETAKAISNRLNTAFGANSFHVAEYATTFFQKYRRQPTFHDQPFIWFGQRERERDADRADIVISDCPTFLFYIYMLYLNDQPLSPETALHLSKIYKRILFDLQTYTDIVFLELKEYKDNGVRYQNLQSAMAIQSRIRTFLDDHRVPYKVRTYSEVGEIIKDMFYINE
jgi:nicotinamide riboside kinase